MDDTAMSSAEAADVTAKKTRIRIATAPDSPRRHTAALGATSPAETSAVAILFGYVGKSGSSSRAIPARPRVVARKKGIENQQRPPTRYPSTVAEGLAATIVRISYDHSHDSSSSITLLV